MTEREHPLEILAYEFVRDTSGAGRYRGGVAYRRDYRFTADEGVLQIRNDRHVFRPYGLCGGRPGGPSVNALNPGKKNGEVMTSKITRYIKKGDVFRYETAGSGGWGDALERETWRVARDIHNEIITAEVARRDYGVVIDAKTWTVDEAATAKLRDQMRAKRGWSGPPFVDRGPLPDGIVPET